jgi:hypothetical protein
MYHVEVRQFPKRVHRFNLEGSELGTIVLPWVQEKIVELGEQKWSPHQATITILEGPGVPLEKMSLSRGWRAAERECADVTERVLAEARTHVASLAGSEKPGAADDGGGQTRDALGLAVQIGALLGPDATRLLEAWVDARSGEPGLSPSEALARAEQELGGAR